MKILVVREEPKTFWSFGVLDNAVDTARAPTWNLVPFFLCIMIRRMISVISPHTNSPKKKTRRIFSFSDAPLCPRITMPCHAMSCQSMLGGYPVVPSAGNPAGNANVRAAGGPVGGGDDPG